jgi:hypothetical protein
MLRFRSRRGSEVEIDDDLAGRQVLMISIHTREGHKLFCTQSSLSSYHNAAFPLPVHIVPCRLTALGQDVLSTRCRTVSHSDCQTKLSQRNSQFPIQTPSPDLRMTSHTKLSQQAQDFGLPISKLAKAMPCRNQDSQVFQFSSVRHGNDEACKLFGKCVGPKSPSVGIRQEQVNSQVTEVLHNIWEIPWPREDRKINQGFPVVALLSGRKKASDGIGEFYLMRSTSVHVTLGAHGKSTMP